MFELPTLIMEIRVVKLLKKSVGKMSSKMAKEIAQADSYFFQPSYNYYSAWESQDIDSPVVRVIMQCEIKVV